jgi:hypothetical protein
MLHQVPLRNLLRPLLPLKHLPSLLRLRRLRRKPQPRLLLQGLQLPRELAIWLRRKA